MTDVQALETLARRQKGVIARWQLIAAGWQTTRCDRALADLTRVYDGVYVTGYGPLTVEQGRWAAMLTAPRTVLGYDSAGAAWNVLEAEPVVPTIVRPGRRGIEEHADLVVRYAATLQGTSSAATACG